MTGILAAMQHSPSDVPAIRTERVELASMSLAFMQALVAGDHDAATREMGAALPGTCVRSSVASSATGSRPSRPTPRASRGWGGRSSGPTPTGVAR